MEISLKHKKQLALIDLMLVGVDYTIAGGFPRDLFFGRVPKDIDVWITYDEASYEDIIQSVVDDFGYEVEDFRAEAIEYVGGDEDTDIDVDDPRHHNIFNVVKIESLGIDLIFVERNSKDVYKAFDFNFNQFVMVEDFAVYRGDTTVKNLVQIKRNVPRNRVYKIAQKFKKEFPQGKITVEKEEYLEKLPEKRKGKKTSLKDLKDFREVNIELLDGKNPWKTGLEVTAEEYPGLGALTAK